MTQLDAERTHAPQSASLTILAGLVGLVALCWPLLKRIGSRRRRRRARR